MKPFRYHRPENVTEAVTMLADAPHGAYLVGGTDLDDLMRLDVASPDLLVDVRCLTSDRVEELPDGGLRIGASVPARELAADPRLRQRYPLLTEALSAGAPDRARNAATTGGDLLHRTRCAFFQDVTSGCNKREPGSGCAARERHHPELAILGGSPACAATHPSDMAVAMTALDAVVRTQRPDGERTIPLTALHRLPGDEPERDTVLEHGELIIAVDLPPPAFTNSRYRRVRAEASYSVAPASVAAALEVTDGVVRDVRIALGGVAPKPWRATVAESALRGAPATQASIRNAATAELAAAQPLPGNAFMVPLVRTTMIATLLELAEDETAAPAAVVVGAGTPPPL
ncbi:FAD binding domain-containing protein [Pseudonocardia alaniniphila]|uniref:Xanthine dehydrogenase family protein subunit M n=1 Tax=Pseudonocardia alaniniphila TaxID=75291 RepID=A0ABS9TTT6_9PSEU|nr:xanthine dehydrogenase family protein subunit M [Pseudonocardia alaniniphila]MCH6171636.1 xanthine dehydrogenase family protein subunit M [Pseudonocardia alaniniphila]